MKIYIMTDLEGVAGVTDRENYVSMDSRYYELGKELLQRVNAAIDGFFEAGAEYILVADGHGYGAINQLMLDQGWNDQRLSGPWPLVWMKASMQLHG